MTKQILTLGKTNQSKLLKYFGYKTIRTAIKEIGKDNIPNFTIKKKNQKYSKKDTDKTLEIMMDEYNRQIEIQNETVPKVKKNIISINDLSKVVTKWYLKKNKTNAFFEVTLKSAIANVSQTYKFRGISHFNNWSEKLLTKDVDSKGDNYDKTASKELFKDVIVVKINITKGGCNTHKAGDKEINTSFYKFNLHNPTSKGNNCLFACLTYIFDINETYHNLRKQFNLKGGEKISINKANEIITSLKLNVEIIDTDINEELDDNLKYILYKENHYYIVNDWEENKFMNKKTKRGLLSFDFETRKTEKYNIIKETGQKMYILKDTLCCGYYKSLKKTCENIKFITNNEKSSARQLIDWFNEESKNGRSYNVIAHNGGKFDYYFFI